MLHVMEISEGNCIYILNEIYDLPRWKQGKHFNTSAVYNRDLYCTTTTTYAIKLANDPN